MLQAFTEQPDGLFSGNSVGQGAARRYGNIFARQETGDLKAIECMPNTDLAPFWVCFDPRRQVGVADCKQGEAVDIGNRETAAFEKLFESDHPFFVKIGRIEMGALSHHLDPAETEAVYGFDYFQNTALVEGDPTKDVAVFADWENKIDLVMKDGVIYRKAL